GDAQLVPMVNDIVVPFQQRTQVRNRLAYVVVDTKVALDSPFYLLFKMAATNLMDGGIIYILAEDPARLVSELDIVLSQYREVDGQLSFYKARELILGKHYKHLGDLRLNPSDKVSKKSVASMLLDTSRNIADGRIKMVGGISELEKLDHVAVGQRLVACAERNSKRFHRIELRAQDKRRPIEHYKSAVSGIKTFNATKAFCEAHVANQITKRSKLCYVELNDLVATGPDFLARWRRPPPNCRS